MAERRSTLKKTAEDPEQPERAVGAFVGRLYTQWRHELPLVDRAILAPTDASSHQAVSITRLLCGKIELNEL